MAGFHYSNLDEIKQKAADLGVTIPFSEDLSSLSKPLTVKGHTIANRLAIQPMEGCDGTANGAPGELTLRRYQRFAQSGAGLIWAEANAIVEEGRANPRQIMITSDNLSAFQSMVANIKETCQKEHGFEPFVVLQLTHSGRYSKPTGVPAPLVAYNCPPYEKENPLSADRIVTDEYLDTLPEQYAVSAKLAEQAGFDGVDIKACHRYLMCELLSGYTRPGRYGGSFENRTRLLRDAVSAVNAAVSGNTVVTSRLNIYDGVEYPYGFGMKQDGSLTPDLTEPTELVRILHKDLGMELLDITIGNPYVNPHVNRPYDQGGYIPPEDPLVGVARMADCIGHVAAQFPELSIISSGLSYLRQFSPAFAAGMVEQKGVAMTGFGREAFAYPTFAADITQKGELDPKKCCITCGKCTELMRMGSMAGCVIRDPEVYAKLYKEAKEGLK